MAVERSRTGSADAPARRPSKRDGGGVKAFLLAGGRGERLRPLTQTIPKCLVPIDGVPLLEIWLGHCAKAGITDVLLNVSHHADRVRAHLSGRDELPRVTLVIEREPVGTAGTVSENRWFVEGEESSWVLYADNLTSLPLSDILTTHRRHREPLTVGLFHAPVPTAAGIVEMDNEGRIVSFEEKPAQPKGDLANAGIYLARSELIHELPDPAGGLMDFGFHVLPKFVGRMFGHVIEQFFMDIGTPAALARASAAWASHKEEADR
jgi:mannose-1-phosphate guanylyltransferase